MNYNMSSLFNIIGGGTPKTTVPEYWGGNIPWISVKDFNNEGRFVYKTEKSITEKGLMNSSTKLLKRGDIIISARGTVGAIAVIPFPMAFNQSCYGLRADERIVDKNFLFYLLKHNLNTLKNNAHGSVFDTITKDTFYGINVDIPCLSIQKKIANVLSSIDDKIEINNQINKNLEEQAQSVFKSWFIDTPSSSTWQTGTFSDIIDTMIVGDWGKDHQIGNNTEMVYCIRGTDIPDVKSGNKGKMPARFILPKNYATKQLVAGDVVVEISGGSPSQSTGRIASISQSLLNRYDKGMVCTNFCKAMKPKPGYSMFVYYYWQYLYDKGVFFMYENGTTGIKNLDISGFIKTELIVLPPVELVKKFNTFCLSLFDVIFVNGHANEQLAKIRDTLLPKLMSGELDVSKLDC